VALGAIGFATNLALALGIGLAVWWGAAAIRSARA
jgi:hypothetical protein